MAAHCGGMGTRMEPRAGSPKGFARSGPPPGVGAEERVEAVFHALERAASRLGGQCIFQWGQSVGSKARLV